MKRTLSILALILAVLMLMTAFAACGSSEKSDDSKKEATEAPSLEGSYKLTDVTGNSADYYIPLQETIKLTIDSKNIGILEIAGTSSPELVFDTDSGKVTSDGLEYSFTFDGKVLLIEDETNLMEFTKQ